MNSVCATLYWKFILSHLDASVVHVTPLHLFEVPLQIKLFSVDGLLLVTSNQSYSQI